MSTGRPLGLRVGLRFGFGDDTEFWPRVKGFLEEIERLETKTPIPLFWNFPVASALERQSRTTTNLVAAIRRRIDDFQDRIVPGGFLGVPHPLLLPEELQHELLWCYRNPWFPALGKLFDMRPESILPLYPDLLSERLAAAYSRHGFRIIGVPIPLYRLGSHAVGSRRVGLKPFANPSCTIPGSDSELQITPIAVIYPGDIRPETIDALLSSCGKADSLHIMFDLGGGISQGDWTGPPAVQKLFRLVSRHRSLEFLPFSGQTLKSPPAAVNPADLLKHVEPGGGYRENNVWDQIESLRKKKRKGNLQVQQLLKTMASAGPAGTTVRSVGVGKTAKLQITNISMTGSVTLIGADLQAAFIEGRLSNLIDRGNKVLPGEPARSFFTFDSRSEALQTDSAFSFERAAQTGLRSILTGRIAQAQELVQVILDYYIADDPSRLTLEMTVHYPPLAAGIVRESTPLELCLCSFAEDKGSYIEAEIPDRGCYREPLAARQSVLQLYGKRFRIPWGTGTVELEAAPAYITRTECIEFRVTKRRAAYLLWANLGGSYLPRPAAFLSTRRQKLSYSIRFDETR